MRGLLIKRTVVSVLILIFSLMLVPLNKIFSVSISTMSELEYCPLCFGTSMCDCLNDNNFALDWNYFWTNMVNLYGVKLVIFGSCNKEFVVVKKYPTGNVFQYIPKQYEIMIDTQDKFLDSSEIIDNLKNSTLQSWLETLPKSQNFKLCPSAEKLYIFFTPIIEDHRNFTEIFLKIFFMMQVNMETLVQQVIKDWAVAEYLGSCGRITVSKYCGDSLTRIVPKLTWAKRSLIAKQLLQFAFNATFEHPNFAFYFTDLSPDNFAVSSQGDVRLIDLEHVIVVDKYPTEKPDNWDTLHQSYHDDSVNGFAFSPDDICSHKTSDLNIYAICLGILSKDSDLLGGGLLNSPPEHMKDLRILIQDCITPPSGKSRFDIAESIINILDISFPSY